MNDLTGPIHMVLGRRLIVSVRLVVVMLLAAAMCGIISTNISTGIYVYETYFNPVPLLSYPDTDAPDDPGMPTDRAMYQPGDTISLTISRSVRVEGTLKNLVYLSDSGEPRGVLINTLEASVPAGYSSRSAAVAQLPIDTRPGIYCLAGVQTITTKYGSLTVPWRSRWFYVGTKEG